MKNLTHINQNGKANMVDVGDKIKQIREAKAQGLILLEKNTLQLISENLMKKGDVLTVAEIAGIQAAKKNLGINTIVPYTNAYQSRSKSYNIRKRNKNKFTRKMYRTNRC